jgi:hypothetical protein
MTIDPRVQALCDEFGVEVIPAHRYPDVGQTRAVKTIQRIMRRHGEAHMRLVMTTLAETANNRALLTEVSLWTVSDLIRACPEIVETRSSDWLELWDECPVGELQFWTQDLAGIVPQRHALSGMIYERIVRRFGPRYMQPDLLDDRRLKL